MDVLIDELRRQVAFLKEENILLFRALKFYTSAESVQIYTDVAQKVFLQIEELKRKHGQPNDLSPIEPTK